eukprot:221856-Pelagomonas_calceolata.AAC.1
MEPAHCDVQDLCHDVLGQVCKFEVQIAEGLEGSRCPPPPRSEQESSDLLLLELNRTARTPFCIPSCLFKDLDKGFMRN